MEGHSHSHAGHLPEDTRRQIMGIRFGKKPKPKPGGATGPDGLGLGNTPVGCCGTCVGAKPVR